MSGQAGIEMDMAVCREVFGAKRIYCRYGKPWTGAEMASDRAFYIPSGKPWKTHSIDALPVPRYSTDIAAAMTLLDSWHGDWKIRRQNDHYKVTLYEPSMQGVEWAETLPLAICRIRLRATRWPLAATRRAEPDAALEIGGRG